MNSNNLDRETSPYLLQHKDNPVHWQPWSADALAAAKQQNKPILLSIGYAACHWCHVMAHESFENPEIAAVMNAHFINIKVDREERPDIDELYMSALQMMGEQGGWPLTMFLTPEGLPFWGGTYFPPEARFGRPGFAELCRELSRIFHAAPEDTQDASSGNKARDNAEKIGEAIRARAAVDLAGDLPDDLPAQAAGQLLAMTDAVHGGLTGAPKFPQPFMFELLWQDWLKRGNTMARDAVLTMLAGVCCGGIYDHLGGGFARYAVDEAWRVPHFEKMLYDNALLIDLMGRVQKQAGDPALSAMLRRRIEHSIEWLAREMVTQSGGFAASLDADTEGEEGRVYVWKAAELESLLGDNYRAFSTSYDVSAGGNFEGVNVLNRLAHKAGFADEAAHAAARDKLFAHRATRPAPPCDDKVLADWNGLMIAALARQAPVFDRPDWLALAVTAYESIHQNMSQNADGAAQYYRLGHSARGGRLMEIGMAEDYANMSDAALALFSATGAPDYLTHAQQWTATLEALYGDGKGGFYMTAEDAGDLIARPHAATDSAVPNANGTMLGVYQRLAGFTGDDSYTARAEQLVQCFALGAVKNYPQMTRFLKEAENVRQPVLCVITPGGGKDFINKDFTDPGFQALLKAAHSNSCPGLIIHPLIDKLATSEIPADETLTGGHPALLETMKAKQDTQNPTAYICPGQSCLAPVEDAAGLTETLNSLFIGKDPVL